MHKTYTLKCFTCSEAQPGRKRDKEQIKKERIRQGE